MSTTALSLTPSCVVCKKEDDLLQCSRCKVTHYCGKGHQSADWNDHKRVCNSTKKNREVLYHEEQSLRNHPGDFMTPTNVFENAVGHFWGIVETREYMRARFALVENLLKIETPDAVEEGLDHLLDMLRLCRGDNMGVRDIVPHLFLRLGRDQECYDFVKWW